MVKDLPKVGICRGGQLFTIMNGGKLVQHISGHGSSNHKVKETNSDFETTVLSCHHQMMDPTEEMIGSGRAVIIAVDPRDQVNEVIWYPERRELAFQSHPEWGHDQTTDYFFELIKRYNL
jgi:gamma-glutamyl-gamma-aminobutyrate hydrolase PuuD